MTSQRLPSRQPCEPSDPVSAKIGKATVEYRYLHDRTIWGFMEPGHTSSLACVVFADLVVSMPENNTLQNVTVTVTLQDRMTQMNPPWIVKFLPVCEHCLFGGIGGGVRSHGPAALESQHFFHPNSSSSKAPPQADWKLSSEKFETLGALQRNNVRWSLDYSPSSRTRQHVIRTAFVVEHGRKKFVIRTKIEATAASVFGRVKNQLSKVVSTQGNNDVVTEFKFPSREEYDECYGLANLGEIDKNIDEGMEYINLRARPKWEPRPEFDVDAFLADIRGGRIVDDELALEVLGTDDKSQSSGHAKMGVESEI